MCGIVGMVGAGAVNQRIYDALTVLQHRGQDAAGIMTYEAGELFMRKDSGLVRDVFQQKHMLKLKGNVGIGHVRYPTAGADSAHDAQPFYVNSPYGLCLGHNGNLTNSRELTEVLVREDRRHLNTSSDSEVLLNVLASELQRVGTPRVTPADIFAAANAVYRRCRGGYAVVVMVIGHGILGFRDPNGIRPLVIGKRETKKGPEWMLASESVALDMLGFEMVRDVAPGEAVFIDEQGRFYAQQCVAMARHTPCIFEYVYFARPDSIIDNISVYKARLRMGEHLAEKIKRERPDHGIDVVIPIPDTSRTSAVQVAQLLGIKYREGFIKNRYIGRTFIMPGQKLRSQSVRQKLNAIDLEFHGKNVLLVDDSIVRGTTSRQIVQMARDVGANKVYFASAAPPVRFPNVYGIDMPAARELVAGSRTVEEVAGLIGADWLVYQDLEDLILACRHEDARIEEFDT
ncbi:MAG TPA: amidophosphoribosyltransferase, partial [Steroidobacteraceae bacterium]